MLLLKPAIDRRKEEKIAKLTLSCCENLNDFQAQTSPLVTLIQGQFCKDNDPKIWLIIKDNLRTSRGSFLG